MSRVNRYQWRCRRAPARARPYLLHGFVLLFSQHSNLLHHPRLAFDHIFNELGVRGDLLGIGFVRLPKRFQLDVNKRA